MPLPIALPIVSRSGSSPHSAVQPPGPAENVCVSSMMSSAPCSRVMVRSASWYPSSGSTIPMFVMAGSARTQAISPVASASRSWPRSLNSTAVVVSPTATAGPTLPSRATVRPSGARTANDSSTEPW